MIFFICTHGEQILKEFAEHLNSLSHDITFTYKFDKENTFFLDLKVISTAGKLMTSLYSKPADSHQYGYYKSSHPELTKRSILHILQTNFTDF